MMLHFRILARLILRFPTLADFKNLLTLRANPDVMRYIGDGSTQKSEQVAHFLR